MAGMWPLERTPRAAPLRAAAMRQRALPAAAAIIRVPTSVDVSDPAVLLTETFGVRVTFHPAVAQLLTEAGAHLTANTATLTVPAAPEPLTQLLTAVRPDTFTTPDGVALTVGDVAALFDMPEPVAVATPNPAPVGHLAVTRKGRKVTVRLIAPRIEIPVRNGVTVKVSANTMTRLTPESLLIVESGLRKAGLVVVDGSESGRLSALGWTYDRRLTITPAPGAPGWAAVDAGELVTSALPPLTPAPDAIAGARPAAGKVALAVDPLVTAVAAGATSGAQPVAIPGVGLLSWQEQFIGRYLGNGRGLVNALPPGVGKTACVAGVMAHLASLGPHRGLVVAPASLIDQWAAELRTFHPSAHVIAASCEADLETLTCAWRSTRRAVVGLCSPAMVAKHTPTIAALPIDDLAVDEGTYLRSDSTQTRALWQVRANAARAVVLTGTPDTDHPSTIPALVSFVAGRPGLAEGTIPPPLTGRTPAELAGAWVYGLGHDLVDVVPAAPPTVTALQASPYERAVQQVATTRIEALMASAGTSARRKVTTLRTELDAWRTGLACPAALLTGNTALGRAVREQLESTGHLPMLPDPKDLPALLAAAPATAGVKPTFVSNWVTDGWEHGRQSLVFADSVPALEVTAQLLTGSLPGTDVAVLSGKVRPTARARLVDAFTQGRIRVLLIAATGQFGLNLQTADRLAHLDVPTSAAVATQRVARAARIGARASRVDVAVPLLTSTADHVWWEHAAGARATTDIIGLATELTKRRTQPRR